MTSARERILIQLRSQQQESARPLPYALKVRFKDNVATFIASAQTAGFEVVELSDLSELPAILDSGQLGAIQTDLLEIIALDDLVQRKGDPKSSDNYFSLTKAELAIAETGSVLVASGPTKEYALHLLVEEEFILVDKETIVPSLDDTWSTIRQHEHEARVFCFITGPSKTADVEQTLQIGAHGPRKTTVILY